MTDAHCHVSGGDRTVRELLIGRDFVGVHPWKVGEEGTGNGEVVLSVLRERLEADPKLGVGEIGLDRLKDKNVSPQMREMFEVQLKLAAEFHRPVVLHGAKCWGQVINTIRSLFPVSSSAFPIPTFLFHGFSRSDGLIPDIVRLNGYVSVGPSVLNDHAVNYRALVKKIPLDRLLIETDRTAETAADVPDIVEIAAKVAELRNVTFSEFVTLTDRNAESFLTRLPESAVSLIY